MNDLDRYRALAGSMAAAGWVLLIFGCCLLPMAVCAVAFLFS